MSISSTPTSSNITTDTEKEENSVINNQTQSLLQKSVSPNVAVEKPETEAQKILKQEKFVSAADILKQEKITTPKNVIQNMQFPTALDILEQSGFESASDILAIEEKEREEFRKKQQILLEKEQKEAELLALQDQYIQKIDPNNFKLPGQNTYETKFGELDFDTATFKTPSFDVIQYSPMVRYANFDFAPWSYPLNEAFFGVEVNVNNKDLIYIPQEFVYKGFSNKQGTHNVINKNFLDINVLSEFTKKSQLIDLGNTTSKFIKNWDFNKINYNKNNLNIGYLIDKKDYNTFFPADNNFLYTVPVQNKLHYGKILGLSYDEKNKRLVYLTEPIIEADQKNSFLYLDGSKQVRTITNYYNKPDGLFGIFEGIPLLGDLDNLLLDIAEEFAQIPFAPEIASLLLPADPATKATVYASLKGVQARGAGGDFEDVIKAAGIAYATTSLKLDKLGEKVGNSLGIENAVVSKAVGTALTTSAFNGIMAAATGGNVKDAMVSGALMGGLSQSGSEITNRIFGGGDSVKGAQNVAKLAKQLNMDANQFNKIFMNSTISASISASRGGDFFKQFTNSAIAQGISTVAANKIKTSLQATGMTKNNVKVLSNTAYNIVNAAAYAAVRGTSVENALKVVGQKELKRQVATKLKQAYQERRQAV